MEINSFLNVVLVTEGEALVSYMSITDERLVHADVILCTIKNNNSNNKIIIVIVIVVEVETLFTHILIGN